MGNQPTKESGGSTPASRSGSTSRHHHHSSSPRHLSSSSSASSPQTPHKSSASSSRAPIGVHNHRAVAPAKASLAQAHGSTDIKNSQALPITSLAASPVGSTKSAVGAAEHKQSAPLPVPFKERALAGPADSATTTAPGAAAQRTLPVDVPNNAATAPGATAATAPIGQTSPLSPFDSSDAGILSHGSLSNMSFISRPPRLPLPIEEEVHTPGSPIVAPTDIGEPVDAVDLDGDGSIARKSSNLSNTTIDEDDAEELRVDKTRPTVPTRLEWRRGGDRVYVTGTIFHWNRKQRLHPV